MKKACRMKVYPISLSIFCLPEMKQLRKQCFLLFIFSLRILEPWSSFWYWPITEIFFIRALLKNYSVSNKFFLFLLLFLAQQDEQENLKRNSVEEEMLTWQDYKAMPFTQCVSCNWISSPIITLVLTERDSRNFTGRIN